MKNPISSVYDKFDDGMIYLTNKAVRAFNWTTGKTKSDLANFFNTGTWTLFIGGSLIDNPIFELIAAPPFLCVGYETHKLNKMLEEKEISALEKGCLDSGVETYKYLSKIGGPIFMGLAGGLAGYVGINNLNKSSENHRIISEITVTLGCLFFSAQYYVMRAECLPPRKSVFARARDKLKEKAQVQVLQPVPVNADNRDNIDNIDNIDNEERNDIGFNYRTLEENLAID